MGVSVLTIKHHMETSKEVHGKDEMLPMDFSPTVFHAASRLILFYLFSK